jgi:hypothetical protein
LRAEDDIAGLVDAMDVAESGGDGEHGADGTQCLVNFPNLKIKHKKYKY